MLRAKPGGAFFTQAFDDIGEAVAAAARRDPVLLACGSHAPDDGGCPGCCLGAGLAAWSIGEWIWSYYEVIAGSEVPFPSLADAGFLLFPVFCLAGLFLRPSAAFVGRARLRVLLDGTMVVASLFILSWATALGAVYHAGAQDTFGFVVSLAYPASDLVLITVARARREPGPARRRAAAARRRSDLDGGGRQRLRLPRRGRHVRHRRVHRRRLGRGLPGHRRLGPVPDAEHASSGERVDGSPVIVLPYLLLSPESSRVHRDRRTTSARR